MQTICKKFSLFCVLLITTWLSSVSTQRTKEEHRESCIVNNKTRLAGVCKHITTCPEAISNLRVGAKVTRCENIRNPAIICCPSERRISEKMCEKYTDVLRVAQGPSPLLPPSFLDEESEEKDIYCNPDLNQLIVGGRDAKPGEYPHLVAIGYNSSKYSPTWRCAGTLISDQFVLTAAHCVIKNNRIIRPQKLLLGDISLTDSSSPSRLLLNVEDIIPHPNYETPFVYNDIALIKMAEKINITRAIYPACLPQPKFNLLAAVKQQNFTAAGWGVLGNGEIQSDILQVVNLKGFSRKPCNAFYNEVPGKELKLPNGITRSQICAGDSKEHKDTCRGDSGGPLTVNVEKRCVFYVAGVTSFGPTQCGQKVPAIYTNVQTYLDWIEPLVWPVAQA